MNKKLKPYCAERARGLDPDGPAGEAWMRLDPRVSMIVDVVAPGENQLFCVREDKLSGEPSPICRRLLAAKDDEASTALGRWIAAESLVTVDDPDVPRWFAGVNADLMRLGLPDRLDELLGGRDAARHMLLAFAKTPPGAVSEATTEALSRRIERARLTSDLRDALLSWLQRADVPSSEVGSSVRLFPSTPEVAADEALVWTRRAVLRRHAGLSAAATSAWLVAAHRWRRAADPEREAACLASAGHRRPRAHVTRPMPLAASGSASSILDFAPPRQIAIFDGQEQVGTVRIRVRQTSCRLTPVGSTARPLFVDGIPLGESPELEGELSSFELADLISMLTFEIDR